MKYKIFVDGQEGTTGLKIFERLEARKDIEILRIDPEKKKDTIERGKYLNSADVAFLCLPDDAAKESVSLVTNPNTCIIDASTAHRTNDDWAYGFPELSPEHREKIKNSKRVAVPGCYATGFNLLMYPLITEKILLQNTPITCHALSGYSGGGKKLIEKYEDQKNILKTETPSFYALGLTHKHIPEMQKISNLDNAPIFTPIVCNYYQGMTVAIPIHKSLMNIKMTNLEIHEFFLKYYNNSHFVKVMPFDNSLSVEEGFLTANNCNNTNRIELFVFGNEQQTLLVSRLDNLGKGASGAAIQNMNIMLGINETLGLE